MLLVSQRYLGASGPVTLAMIHCPNHQYIIAMVPSQPSLLYVVQAGSDVFQTELFPPRIPHLKRYIYAHSIYQEDGFHLSGPRGHVNAKDACCRE